MEDRTLTSDEEAQILELYEKVTVAIPGLKTEIRAISFDGFKIAVEQMMQIADLKGKLEALDVSLKAIRSAKFAEL
jgi:hypothetical protein